MSVKPDVFREVLGHLAGGVTVVTTRDATGRPLGLTATAVVSVSLEPPMVLVSIGGESDTHAGITESGMFAVNFLPAGDRELADTFALDSDSKFEGVGTDSSSSSPVLDRAMAWCAATVVHEVSAGDHTVFIGRVESAAVREDMERQPLVHYRGRYVELRDPQKLDP